MFDGVLEVEPDLAAAHALVAGLDVKAGRLEAAEAAVARALAIDPEDGTARWIEGQIRKAIESAREAPAPTARGEAGDPQERPH